MLSAGCACVEHNVHGEGPARHLWRCQPVVLPQQHRRQNQPHWYGTVLCALAENSCLQSCDELFITVSSTQTLQRGVSSLSTVPICPGHLSHLLCSISCKALP
jgi:hypothetical protein